MFTGIVEEIGVVSRFQRRYPAARLTITSSLVISDVRIGDSIAVDGVCLTVVAFDERSFSVDVQEETVNRSVFAAYRDGMQVNLERAVTPATRLGGHYVQGHIDGVASVTSWHQEGNDWVLRLDIPQPLRKYVVEKGFVAVNGISLTVAGIHGGCAVHVIPHTREITTLQYLTVGSRVNIEVDIIAKYVESLVK
jgi:riboflavin synthase